MSGGPGVLGFCVLSIGLVALAGPLPTIVVGTLVLIFSGILLTRSAAVIGLINPAFGLSGSTKTATNVNKTL